MVKTISPFFWPQAVNSSAVSFPVWISLGPLRIHPHFLFELLAYAVAGVAYWRGRRTHGDHVSSEARWALSAAAVGFSTSGRRSNDRRRLARRMARGRVAKTTNRHSRANG